MNTSRLYFPETRRLIQINNSDRMFHRVYEVSWTLFCFMVLFISWARFKITTIQNVKNVSKYCEFHRYIMHISVPDAEIEIVGQILFISIHIKRRTHKVTGLMPHFGPFYFLSRVKFQTLSLHLSPAPALTNFACLFPRHFQKADILSKCFLALAERTIFDTRCTELQLLHQFNSLDVIVKYFIKIVLREHSPHSPGECGQEAASWCLSVPAPASALRVVEIWKLLWWWW